MCGHDHEPWPLPQPPASNFDQKTCEHQQNVRLILTPPHQTCTQRAGERGQMCAKIITLRNQPKCTILDPKNSNNDSFGIHSVKVLVQVHYLILFRKRKKLVDIYAHKGVYVLKGVYMLLDHIWLKLQGFSRQFFILIFKKKLKK